MDHSAPITLNANQGRRRATKRCPPMRAVAKPSKPKLAPRSQKWPLGHRQGTMLRCATATVPTASHTSQAPISTTQDANSASAALHASPCAALRPRSSLSIYIFIGVLNTHLFIYRCPKNSHTRRNYTRNSYQSASLCTTHRTNLYMNTCHASHVASPSSPRRHLSSVHQAPQSMPVQL